MANYSNLLATIAANIYTNGNNEVTASMVKAAVDAMVASLGAGYQFMGVAHPTDTPSGYADIRCLWLAFEAGTYTDFGGNDVTAGKIGVIKYDSAWSLELVDVPLLAAAFAAIEQKVNRYPGVNLVDPAYIQKDSLFTWAGNVYPSNGYAITGYIPVNGKDIIANAYGYTGSWAWGCVYDKDLNLLRTLTSSQYTYTAGDAYVRFSFFNYSTPSNLRANYGTTLESYEPYDEISRLTELEYLFGITFPKVKMSTTLYSADQRMDNLTHYVTDSDYDMFIVKCTPGKYYMINGQVNKTTCATFISAPNMSYYVSTIFPPTPNSLTDISTGIIQAPASSEYIIFSKEKTLPLDVYELYLAEDIYNDIQDLKDTFPVVETHLYVATDGDDVTGDGTPGNPFASIYHANEIITDNSAKHIYYIHVADGTYTDLQTKYAGSLNTTQYEGVICKDYVNYIGNPDNPSAVVISWDGATGYPAGTFRYQDGVNYGFLKCPFHITNGHTSVIGFTLNCKNTRYALHIECAGAGKGFDWLVSDCNFIWNGCPDCPDISYDPPVIGTGCGFYEIGHLLRCIITNNVDSYGFANHDSAYSYNGFKEGANITIESCDFGNTSIMFRSMTDAIDGYERCQLINCIGVDIFTYTYYSPATSCHWRALVKCSDIADNVFETNGMMQ